MRTLVAVAFVLLGSLAVARADVAARQRAGRAVFDAQIRALADGKLDAFVALFPDTDKVAAMFPGSRAAAVGRTAIRDAAADWAGSRRRPATVRVIGTPIVGVRPEANTTKRPERLVVVTGDLEVTLRGRTQPLPLRMTSVLASGYDTANPRALSVIAVFVSEPIEDRRLRGQDVTGEHTQIDRFLDMLRFPDVLAAHFDAAPDDIVIGSSADERATGADASKLLQRWKDLRFVIVGKPHMVKEPDWMYVMATVSMARGKNQKPTPLHVLLVGYPECRASCVGIEMTPHVVALHFGQPR